MRWSLESMKLLRCSLLVARFPLPPRQNRRRLHAHTHTHTQGHIHPCVHLGVQQLRGGISKLEGKAAASKTRGKLSATPLPFPTAGARLLSGAVSSRAGRLLPERPPLRGAARTSPCSAERLVLPEFGAACSLSPAQHVILRPASTASSFRRGGRGCSALPVSKYGSHPETLREGAPTDRRQARCCPRWETGTLGVSDF